MKIKEEILYYNRYQSMKKILFSLHFFVSIFMIEQFKMSFESITTDKRIKVRFFSFISLFQDSISFHFLCILVEVIETKSGILRLPYILTFCYYISNCERQANSILMYYQLLIIYYLCSKSNFNIYYLFTWDDIYYLPLFFTCKYNISIFIILNLFDNIKIVFLWIKWYR